MSGSSPGSPIGRAALSRGGEAALLGLILLAAAAFRWYRLGELPMRIDEISTAYISRLPAAVILKYWGGMPLLFLLTKACTLVSGAKAIIFLPPFLEGLAGVAAVWALGRLLAGPATGLLAAALAASHPMAIYYSQDARYYAFLMLCSTLAALFLVRALERGGAWWWLFGAVSFLNFLNHASAWLVLAGQGVTAALLILLKVREEGLGRREALRQVKAPLVASLLVAGTYLTVFLARLLAQEGGNFWQRKFQQGGLAAAGRAALVTNPERFGELAATFGGTDFLAANLLLILACLAAAFLNARNAAWFAGTVAIPLAALTAAGARKWEVRYLVFMLPLYLVLLAEGWRLLVSRALPAGAARWRPALLASLAVIIPCLSLGSLAAYYGKPKQAWRMAADLLGRAAAPRDVVIVPGPREAEGISYYLDDRVDPGLTLRTVATRFRHGGFLLDRERRELAPLDEGAVRRRREGGAAVWRLYWLIENPRRRNTVGGRFAGVLDQGGLIIPFLGMKSDLLWTVVLPPDASGRRLERWRELAAQARAVAPGDGGLMILEAELRLAAGDRGGAVRRLEEAARERSSAPGLLARGFLESLAGRADEAALFIRRAREADPFDLQAGLAGERKTLVREVAPVIFSGGGGA